MKKNIFAMLFCVCALAAGCVSEVEEPKPPLYGKGDVVLVEGSNRLGIVKKVEKKTSSGSYTSTKYWEYEIIFQSSDMEYPEKSLALYRRAVWTADEIPQSQTKQPAAEVTKTDKFP